MKLHQAFKSFLNQCGTDKRVHPAPLPPDCQLPAITYQNISGAPVRYLNYTGAYRARYQVTIWASTLAMASEIANQVMVLHDFNGNLFGLYVIGTILNRFDLPEPETGLKRTIIDLQLRKE